MRTVPAARRKLVVLAFVASIALAASGALAGTNVWTTGGPVNGTVQSLVIDLSTPATVYAANYTNGIFKSVNRGGSWAHSGPGHCTALVIDPLTPATLYAATDAGVYKSTDSGGTWNAMNSGLFDTNVSALAIDPGTSSTLYARTFGGGVFKSVNSGGNWNSASAGLTTGYIYSLAIDPVTPATLYAGTSVGVFKTVDGGSRGAGGLRSNNTRIHA